MTLAPAFLDFGTGPANLTGKLHRTAVSQRSDDGDTNPASAYLLSLGRIGADEGGSGGFGSSVIGLAPILLSPASLGRQALQSIMRVHRDGFVGPFERRLVAGMIGIETDVAALEAA